MVWRGDRTEKTEQVEAPVEQEPFYPDDDPDEYEYADRSIFSTGWFRAILVLAALAIAVVASLPYILDWFEPAEPSVKAPVQTKPASPTAQAVPVPSAPSPSPTIAEKAPSAIEPPSTPAIPAPEPAPTLAAPTTTQDHPRVLPAVQTAAPERRQVREAAPSKGGNYWVQLGVFKDAGNAERLARKVRGQSITVQVAAVKRNEDGTPARTGDTYYVVRAGGFPDRARATAARDDLKARGHAGFLTEGSAK